MRCFGHYADDRICELCGICNTEEFIDCREIYEEDLKRARESCAKTESVIINVDDLWIDSEQITNDWTYRTYRGER